MSRQSCITHYFLLLTAFLFLCSCTPQLSQSPPQTQTTLLVYRLSPPAFVEFSKNYQVIREFPFSPPPNCGLLNLFSPLMGKSIAIELSCPNGQTVLFLDSDTDAVTQPVADSDSHFLAWSADGKAVYLKVDLMGNPHIARVETGGKNETMPISEFSYDLSANPQSGDFTFTFSRGLGQGSELWFAKQNGRTTKQLYVDPSNYISFAHFSPDGSQIAFIKIPDTQTPFTVGELWVMNADGSEARKLADADAGHGYAANWSPDGKRIAFVARENSRDTRADQSSDALISNIYIVDVASRTVTQVSHVENGRAETPVWSPDGNTLAFNVVINDRMQVRIAEISTGKIQSLMAESTCCAAWIRK